MLRRFLRSERHQACVEIMENFCFGTIGEAQAAYEKATALGVPENHIAMAVSIGVDGNHQCNRQSIPCPVANPLQKLCAAWMPLMLRR